MPGELLYGVKEWVIFVALFGLIFSATEIGFQIGRRLRSSIDDASRSEYNTIQGAVLGLLALLLGFTFAMSVSRYQAGKELIIDESNAIGTTFLRARFLPEPYGSEVSNLMRRYVDVLLKFYGSGIDPKNSARRTTRRNEYRMNFGLALLPWENGIPGRLQGDCLSSP